MDQKEYNALFQACLQLESAPDYRMDNYALNIINTVLDFQSRVETVNCAMSYYKCCRNYQSHKKLRAIVDSFPNTKQGNVRLASHLWSNNMWTRAEFPRVLLEEFENRGILGQKSLNGWLANADFKRDVKGQFNSKHHSMGDEDDVAKRLPDGDD